MRTEDGGEDSCGFKNFQLLGGSGKKKKVKTLDPLLWCFGISAFNHGQKPEM